VLDAIGMGLGFTFGLTFLGGLREILGSGKLFGATLFPTWEPWVVMILPAGGFLTLGLILGCVNLITRSRDTRQRRLLVEESRAAQGIAAASVAFESPARGEA
jgi:electron transport complex protein RnfE